MLENSLCEFSPGTMFCRGRSNILKEKTKVKSNEECAKLCKEEPSCNHWTRRKKDNFGRCWLKKTDSCTKENDKYDSGINCKGGVTLSLNPICQGVENIRQVAGVFFTYPF